MQRPVAIRLLALLVALFGVNITGVMGQVAASANVGIDHLILGVDDLERGMAEFARRTGVTPVKGGVHPGRGTQNALVSLGEGRYLEILAPSHEPGAPIDRGTTFAALTPVGWALHTDDLPAMVAAMRAAIISVSDIRPGARARPDGARLEWQTASVTGVGLEMAPFFIAWGRGTPHPSSESPTGCRLMRVAMAEPSPDALQRFLDVSGVDVRVMTADTAGMTVVLQCPTGEVTFQSAN